MGVILQATRHAAAEVLVWLVYYEVLDQRCNEARSRRSQCSPDITLCVEAMGGGQPARVPARRAGGRVPSMRTHPGWGVRSISETVLGARATREEQVIQREPAVDVVRKTQVPESVASSINGVALAQGCESISQVESAESLDYTPRTRTLGLHPSAK